MQVTGSNARSCPPGFTLDVPSNAHDLYNCRPNNAASVKNPDGTVTACKDGHYCPEATPNLDKAIPCEPGTSQAGAGAFAATSRADCEYCTPGKFCPAGILSSN